MNQKENQINTESKQSKSKLSFNKYNYEANMILASGSNS